MPSVQLDEFLRERPEVNPTIYAYTIPEVEKLRGYIKVGFTDRNVEARIKEQLHTAGLEWKILFKESAMCADGSCFTDKQVHKILERRGFTRLNQGKDRNEWFFCKEEDVLAAIKELRTGKRIDEDRNETFEMRPEQERAVEITSAYFKAALKEKPESPPKFLWNAKMRFGKTFAAYKLAQSMKLKRILVLTFKPAVESAWADDLYHHVDFKGWQFISNKDARDINFSIDEEFEEADKNKPIVVFGSFQDLLGRNDAGGIKAKNEFIHSEKWDLVIFDEYHFGAWRENAKNLFEKQDEEAEVNFDQEEFQRKEAANAMDESFLPITTKYYLYLSGTPFRALNSGEFIEEQIFNWTYSDEQRAKETWVGKNNPYKALPRMVLMTYKIPESIREVASQGEFDEFDLNE
ncbi:GIY-YIG nuclease family protein, partial [Candidatus Saccharibacteria bacterium]|nr:GIY-YIG nuclease family protein [Candidatus Saccharibacteria bacterium]